MLATAVLLPLALTCRDLDQNCNIWAAASECDNNPAFMHSNCALACGTCDKMVRSCDDIGEDSLAEGGIEAAMQQMLAMPSLTPKVLSSDPWVLQLETFASVDEVDDILRVGGHNFSRSLAGYGNGQVQARTSSTSWCNVPSCEDDAVMMRLKTKITSALSCPMKNTEHLQVLKYEPGQFYRSHHDQNSPYDSPAGPRIFTFFLYLSDVTEGGETYFPKLGLTVTPKSGSALVWASVSDDNIYTDDPRTQHEAMPVIEGVKYAANFWTHLRDFQTPHAAGCGTGPVPTAVARKAAAAGRARQYLEARRTVESSGEGRGGSASQDSNGQATTKEEL